MKEASRESKEFWKHVRFPDLGLLKARFRHHRYDRHTHPHYVIALITEGCERVTVGRREVVAPAGMILLVNPEEWHDGQAGSDQGWAYKTFYPTIPFLRSIGLELGLGHLPEFRDRLVEDRPLAGALARAHALSSSADPTCADEALLVAFRRLILRHCNAARRELPDEGPSERRMATYEALIERNLVDHLDLGRLAAAAKVTRFQVIRDFRRAVGMTPGAFIRDRRLRRAASLIEAGALLREAAHEAGFCDQSHLSRAFRQAHGITPGMFRRAQVVTAGDGPPDLSPARG